MAVVNASGVGNLLRPEGDKDGGALGGKSTEGVYLPGTVGEDGIKAVLLLEPEGAHLAEVLSGDGEDSLSVAVKFFQGAGGVNKGNEAEHHSLVTACEVLKHLLSLLPL